MAEHATLTSLFTDIADAIREKNGSTEVIVADSFPTAVRGIKSGGFPNGTEWTQSNVTSGFFSGKILNEKGIWLAYYISNGIYYSADGKVWQQTNLVAASKIRQVAFGGGIFVAASDTGLYYSDDGIVWTQGENATFTSYGVCFGAGVLVARTSTSGLYFSLDGKVWQQSNVTSGMNDTLHYANGAWVAGSRNGDPSYFSSNGAEWSTIDIEGLRNIAYGDGVWLATAYQSTLGQSVLLYSTNGMEWEQTDLNVSNLKAIGYYNGTWCAHALTADGSIGIIYSVDGKNWTSTNLTAGTFSGLWTGNGMWITATSSDSSGVQEGIYCSEDGKEWEFASAAVVDGAAKVYCASGVWVMGSSSNEGTYYSVDGRTWLVSNEASLSIHEAVCKNGIWVVCMGTGSYGAGLYYSVTWEPSA